MLVLLASHQPNTPQIPTQAEFLDCSIGQINKLFPPGRVMAEATVG